MAGKRESLSKKVFEEAGFPESKVEMLSLILSKSRGGAGAGGKQYQHQWRFCN